jgi:hypothetical protein
MPDTQTHNGPVTQPLPTLPSGQPPQRSRRQFALIALACGAFLATLAALAIVLISNSKSTPVVKVNPNAVYQQKLTTTLGPLVADNGALATALGNIDGSQHTITVAQHAATAAQAALTSANGAVAILTVPTADTTLSQQVQQALTQENGYLQGVSATLSDPVGQSSSALRSLVTATQSAFIPLNGIAPGASNSLNGTDNLLSWVSGANGAAKGAAAKAQKPVIINNPTTVVTPAPIVTPTPESNSSGLTACDPNISVNSVTSCGFAENVFLAYYDTANEGDATVTAFSPATGNTYDIDCSTDGVTVNCSGGTTDGGFVTFPMSAVTAY